MSPSPESPSAQTPIEDYALIGDCRTAALVSRGGSIDWLCLPHYSSPPIFASLLDRRRGGCFAIRPRGEFTSARRYCSATPILETTFETASGVVRVLDLLPVLDGVSSLQPLREIQRIVQGDAGVVDLEIHLELRPDFGRRKPRLRMSDKLGWAYSWLNELLVVCTDIDLVCTDLTLHGSVRIHAGERRRLSLAYTRSTPGVLPPLADADRRFEHTSMWWRSWSDQCTYAGAYKEVVLRSALTLKLLSFALSGAIVAAPTTSLPEVIGGERNWDYRYCWLRDAGLTMQALVGVGFREEARAFLTWLLHATRLTWPRLQVVYDVYGRTRLREQELASLEGYRDSRPVRVGNGAWSQTQLDVYGEVILAADAFVAGGGVLEAADAWLLKGFGRVVCRQWREADHGVWEVRGERRQYTFSKVMCWLALDRLIGLHEKRIIDLESLTREFCSERDAIRDLIEQRGFNTSIASYTGEIDGDAVDASLLLMTCLGYSPASDPRMVTTYERIVERLGCNGLLFRSEHGRDGLEGREGAFGMCSLWAVDSLALRGQVAEARRLFEHVLSFASDVGLFGEEIDPQTGAALGNYPQAFTHVGVINAALAIDRALASGK
ncbi:MAG: glycoside hydrolase family 15 protein [Steroidobacter sp.]